MRAFSRLLSWKSGLRARERGGDAALDRSHPDFRAFALDRYAPHQQREIARLVARQSVISRSDIADALARAERKVRRGNQLTGLAVGAGFVATFALGMIAARHQPPPPSSAGEAAASTPLQAGADDGHWSPGGLDEADRQFFAELQAGRIATRNAPSQPRPQVLPVAAPAAAPTPKPAVIVAAAPVVPPAPQPAARPASIIQLGAFADAGAARARWQAMTAQFSALRPLNQSVSPVTNGGRTLYRLRASGADAARACPALTGAGATCVVIGPATTPAPQPPVVVAAAAPASPPPVQPAAARRETVIQLGAFANAAVAKARWQALSTQFPSLRPLTQTVSAVARGGRTIYRLRASGVDAANACSTLAGAGATCFVATDEG